jgi:hypothetical protein
MAQAAGGGGDAEEGDGDIYLRSVKRNAEELAQQSQGGLTSTARKTGEADENDARDTRGLRDTAAAAAPPPPPQSESKGAVNHQPPLGSDTAGDRDTMPELELVAAAEVDLSELD